jgi:hypothetical protein
MINVSDYSRAGGRRQFEKTGVADDTASLLVGALATGHDENERGLCLPLRTRPVLLPFR